MKKNSEFKQHILKYQLYLKELKALENINNFITERKNIEKCLELAPDDPCWRFFYKKVDSLKLKDLILGSLWT